MRAVIYAAVLIVVAAAVLVWLVTTGEARYRRASRSTPDLGDLLAARLDPVSTEMDEQWSQINSMFTATPCTPNPAYPLPSDEAVRRAGQLPLTWRERRALVDEFERIVNPEATR